MSTKLIPLADIPYAARKAESRARREYPNRDTALAAATIKIVVAEGCYWQPSAPVIGWCLTRAAGEALASIETHMPGGSSHCEMDFEVVA